MDKNRQGATASYVVLALCAVLWVVLPSAVHRFAQEAFAEFQAPALHLAGKGRDLARFWELKSRDKEELLAASRDLARANMAGQFVVGAPEQLAGFDTAAGTGEESSQPDERRAVGTFDVDGPLRQHRRRLGPRGGEFLLEGDGLGSHADPARAHDPHDRIGFLGGEIRSAERQVVGSGVHAGKDALG